MNIKSFLFVFSILLFATSILFYDVLYSDSIFLTQDSISAKSIKHGIEKSTVDFGEYPKWMPWIFGGLPSTHSMQNISEYYYPHHIIKLIKIFSIPWFWNFLIHFLFAGLGMYVLLNHLKLNFFSSLFGSLAYTIMPWMITMIVHGHGSQVMTAAYIPWVVWAMFKLKNEPELRYISILALLIGLQLQRAHVQIAYYTWILMGIYIIYDLYVSYYSKSKYDVKFIAKWAFASIIGFCMSLWIYIPLLNYAPFSKRSSSAGGASFEYATSWSMHPYESLTMLLPSSFGFGELTYFGFMPMTNFPNYSGIVIVFMTFFAFHKTSRQLSYFFLTILITSLLISFGKHTFIYEILYNWLPYFNKFRVPSMILILFQFSITVLAAIGLNNLCKNIKDKRVLKKSLIILGTISIIAVLRLVFHDFSNALDKRVTTNNLRVELMQNDLFYSIVLLVSISVLIYLFTKSKIKSRLFLISIISLSYLDFYRVNSKIIYPDLKTTYSQDIPMKNKDFLNKHLDENYDDIISYLKKDDSYFRVFEASFDSQGRLRPEHNNNRLAAFNIESINGYHPAKLSIYESFNSVPLLNRLKLFNVKYLILSNEVNIPALKLVKAGSYFSNLSYRKVFLYEYLDFHPRVQFLEKINKVDNRQEGYQKLNSEIFDLKKDSFVSSNDFNEDLEVSYNSESEILIKEHIPNKIVLSVNAKGDSSNRHFVLLSEVYFPHGWKISGASDLEIIEVNNLFRGFFVPNGSTEITLEFNPSDLKYSALVSHFSLIVILILYLVSLFYRKNEKL
ncbi:MAG: hypothetical protein CMG26_07060 [Candidatus Marinimicrobia bacterium]|nr:hypothetical protein [Candidatus Neomarinimicrobiota bacterium]